MLTHSTRRWLAGLGVAGAFVAASASPAVAAPEAPIELGVYFSDTTIAAESEGKIDSPLLFASEPVVVEGLTVTYDYRDLSGVVQVKPESSSFDCKSPEAGVLVCTDPFEIGLEEWAFGGLFEVALTPAAKAADGDTGNLKVTVSAEGLAPASHTAKLRIGEGVDLAAPGEETNISSAPGGTFSAPLTLSNAGKTTAKGAVAVFDLDYAIRPDKQYSNCTYEDGHLRTCAFDEVTAAGKARSVSLSYVLGKDTYAPGSEYGYYNWMTIAEFEDFNAYLQAGGISVGKPGNGPVLSLPEVPSEMGARGFQADTRPDEQLVRHDLQGHRQERHGPVAVARPADRQRRRRGHAHRRIRQRRPGRLDFGRSGSRSPRSTPRHAAGGHHRSPGSRVLLAAQRRRAGLGARRQARREALPLLPVTSSSVSVRSSWSTIGLRIDKAIENAAGTVTIKPSASATAAPRT